MDAHRTFLDVISGRNRSAFGRMARLGLSACVPFYRAGTGLRGLSFDNGWRKVHSAPVPVISVGNLSTGGTGKTPTVAWICNLLFKQGMRPGILSRGYKSLDDAGNDEKRLLDGICPGVPHIQNPDRVAGARQAVDEHECDVLVLDDGFQHRRLHRDLDVVVIDAVNPWGHLLPRGLLREPPTALRRADLVLITRFDQVDVPARELLQDEIHQWTRAPICVSRFEPTRWIDESGDTFALESLTGRRVAAFCGIGNPEGFARTLAGIGMSLADEHWRIYPDHHHYDSQDLLQLHEWGVAMRAECLVTTRKDLVKVSPLNHTGLPIRALDIALEIGDPEPLLNRLQAVICLHSQRRVA